MTAGERRFQTSLSVNGRAVEGHGAVGGVQRGAHSGDQLPVVVQTSVIAFDQLRQLDILLFLAQRLDFD